MLFRSPSGEGDSLASYQFRLYDEDMRLIEEYPKKYANTPMIEQTIKDLEPNRKYILQLLTESLHGVMVDLIKEFIPIYDFPILGETTFLVENLKDKPSVKIDFELYQINGTVNNGESISFDDNTWVNLNGKSIHYDTDFYIEDDFIMKLWCKDLDNNEVICKIFDGNDGVLDIVYSYKRVHVCKYRVGTPHENHVVCNTVVDPSKNIFITLKQVNNMIDLVCQQQ